MGINKIDLRVKIANINEFSRLVGKFEDIAQDLSSVALELTRFEFKGEIENQAMPTNSNDADSENL